MTYVNNNIEEFNNFINNRKVAIVGLDKRKEALIEYLYKQNVDITLFDNCKMEEIDKVIIDKIFTYELKNFFGENALSRLKEFDLIITDEKNINSIKNQTNSFVITEKELSLKLTNAKTIGIIKTEKENTIKNEITKILETKQINSYFYSNIDFDKILNLKSEDYLILELNNYELANYEICTNVLIAKEVEINKHVNFICNILEYQNKSDLLVLNYDNELIKKLAINAKGKVEYFSIKEKLENGFIVNDNIIKYSENGLRRHVLNIKNLQNVNLQDLICAIAATKNITKLNLYI